MKYLAVVLAAIVSFTLVAPAFAQPFADVPTDHWAYDAIAELAAKGLIEGYPDGAFRGDRAATRYEMAMVVARLLARIEAIKIPPLPGDLARTAQVTAASAADRAAISAVDQRLTSKLATIQRLVAEFRAELAALGVRVTAVEEELAAIRARLDNTKITGNLRTRYNVCPADFPADCPVGTNGGGAPDARIRGRLVFTGQAGPNVVAVFRLWLANNLYDNHYDTRFGANGYSAVSYDWLYLDIKNTYGAQLWRLGRQYYTLGLTGIVGGLLYDPPDALGAMTPFTQPRPFRAGLSDGLLGRFAWGPINLDLAIFRRAECMAGFPTGGGGSVACVGQTAVGGGLGGAAMRDYRIARATTSAILPGWTLGASYYQEWVNATAPVATSGGTGWGADLSGNLIPGISLFVDWATWNSVPCVGCGSAGSQSAWRVGGNVDFTKFGVTTFMPNVDFAYENYGGAANPAGVTGGPLWVAPTETYATTDVGQYHTWDMRGFLVQLNLTFGPKTTGFAMYEGGNRISTGQSYNEWWLQVKQAVATNTTVSLNYFRTACGVSGGVPCPGFGGTGGTIDSFYRAELLYSW